MEIQWRILNINKTKKELTDRVLSNRLSDI